MEKKWAATEIKGATETLRVIISKKLWRRKGYISQQYPISKNIQQIQELINWLKNTLPWPPWSSAAPTLSFSESPLTLFVATNVPPRLSHDVSFQTSRNFSITACRTWVTIGTFGASNFNFWQDLWVSDGWSFTNLEISKCESENHWLRVLK